MAACAIASESCVCSCVVGVNCIEVPIVLIDS